MLIAINLLLLIFSCNKSSDNEKHTNAGKIYQLNKKP